MTFIFHHYLTPSLGPVSFHTSRIRLLVPLFLAVLDSVSLAELSFYHLP